MWPLCFVKEVLPGEKAPRRILTIAIYEIYFIAGKSGKYAKNLSNIRNIVKRLDLRFALATLFYDFYKVIFA